MLLLVLLIAQVYSHGRLTVPTTRKGNPQAYENDPVGYQTGQVIQGNQLVDWICRHDSPLSNDVATWTAGNTISLNFDFGVNHVGFCDGHISYDVGITRTDMRWIKIANWLDCGGSNSLPMTIPAWLKTGRAVFRWSWTALHHFPDIEAFVQCAEVDIQGGAAELSAAVMAPFPFINPQLYPRDGHDGVGYADPWNGSADNKDRVVGAPCGIPDYGLNECYRTKPGEQGSIDPHALGSPQPTASTTPQPTATPNQMNTPNPTNTPYPSMTPYPTPPPTSGPPSACSQWVSGQSNVADSWCETNCAWSISFCTTNGVCHCADNPPVQPCWESIVAHVATQWCIDTCAWNVDFCLKDGFCQSCSGTPSPTVATPNPTSAPTASPIPTPEPTYLPTPSPIPTPNPTTAQPTVATPNPTAAPTASPIPTPNPTALPTSEGGSEAIRLCYFSNWARYRPDMGSDIFEDGFDSTLCTHMNYGFGTIDPSTFEVKAYDPNADHPSGDANRNTLCPEFCKPGYVHDWSTGSNPCEWPCAPDRVMRGFEGMTQFAKRSNPEMKALLSLGGWNFNDCTFGPWSGPHFNGGTGYETCEIFSTIASSESNTRQFAQHAITFLRNWGFDGLDIDWEYPVAAGHNKYVGTQSQKGPAVPEDYANYITFLRVLREEFEHEASSTGNARLLLTVAVGVGKATADESYDIAKMNQHLDLIALMTYDLHGGWDHITGFNAPLYATQEDHTAYGGFSASVSWAVDYWIGKGASPSKLLMGIGTYGRGWQLQDAAQTGPLAPTNGVNAAGPSTQLAGYLAYYEIQALIANGADEFYDAARGVPYIVTSDGQWIGYDNPQSITEKLNFMKSRNLAGSMVWAADLDNTQTGFPLLSHIRTEMAGYQPSN